MNYFFTCKINIGVTLSRTAPGSIKCPYFAFHYFTQSEKLYMTQKVIAYSANDQVLQSFEVFFLVAKYEFCLLACDTQIQSGKFNVFFFENFDPRATVDLIDRVLLFPGKMLVFGWISPDLEANRVYYWSYSESIHISQILVLIFITKLSCTKFFTRKVMSKAGPRISFLGAYN